MFANPVQTRLTNDGVLRAGVDARPCDVLGVQVDDHRERVVDWLENTVYFVKFGDERLDRRTAGSRIRNELVFCIEAGSIRDCALLDAVCSVSGG